MWAPALLFAREWLSYAVATAREELAERVGFVEAVQTLCRRTTTAVERFCAAAALDWVRSGDLGKSMEAWHEVVVGAAGSRSHDVRNAALQVMELLEIWNGISMQDWAKLQRGESLIAVHQEPTKLETKKPPVVVADVSNVAKRAEIAKPVAQRVAPPPAKLDQSTSKEVVPSSSTVAPSTSSSRSKRQSWLSKSVLWFLLGLFGSALLWFSLQRAKRIK